MIGSQLAAFAGVKNTNDYPGLIIFAALTGFFVSLAQALVIYQKIEITQQQHFLFTWILMSSICTCLMIGTAPIIMFFGFMIASFLRFSSSLGIPLLFSFFGLLSGTATGFIQHFFFPDFHSIQARKWVLFSGIACSLALGIAALVVSSMFKEPIIIFENISGTNQSIGIFGITIFSLISGIIHGGITGIQIIRIFRF